MNKHESRIAALEQNRQRHSGVEVTGDPRRLAAAWRGSDLRPGVGDMCLERGEDEVFPKFVERAGTAAALAGQGQVIIGGLGDAP